MDKVFPPDRFGALKNCALPVILLWVTARVCVGLIIAPFLRGEEETASVTLGER